MESGNLKWFNVLKGYGFIKPDKGDDVFVHVSTLTSSGINPGTLKEGQRVSFELTTNKAGKISAINLKLLKSDA